MTNAPIYLVISSPAECVSYYTVEYKLSSEAGYTSGGNQTPVMPLMLYNLQEDTVYNVRVTPFCCNGQYGTPLIFNVNTSALPKPTDFVATAGDSQVTLTWADMSVDNYVIMRAEDSLYTVNLTEVYNGVWTASVVDTPLDNGVTYYYEIKSQLSGHPDSEYSEYNATPTP